MKRVKRETNSGVVKEQEFYSVGYIRNAKTSEPRLRFRTEEEREAHKLAMARKRHERLVNENFSPASFYATLTFDLENECHDYEEVKCLRRRYIRRLKRKYPDARIMAYMGRGRHTNRYHVHMIIEGAPESFIKKQWIYGSVKDIKHLRVHNFYDGVDHGCDYTALANYLFDHWEPEQGKHRWFGTRNLRKPERGTAKEVKRTYTAEKPPRTPKGYMLVDVHATRYGYICFKYVMVPDRQRLRN